MTAQAIKLKVTASIPKDCIFQLEDDGWNGACEELSVSLRGSSFEDAKRKMEAASTSRVSCTGIPGQRERGLPNSPWCKFGFVNR